MIDRSAVMARDSVLLLFAIWFLYVSLIMSAYENFLASDTVVLNPILEMILLSKYHTQVFELHPSLALYFHPRP